jgi:hypothetical protein
MDFQIVPENDGVDHINVYSKGLTQLGRDLSNFAPIGFNHPQYGCFASMEAYYHWVKTGMVCEELRPLFGYWAKQAAKDLPVVPHDNFESIISEGLRCKVLQNDFLAESLKASTAPLVHYYNYGGRVVTPKGQDYQMRVLTELRDEL